jgi:phage tail-like protein
MADYEDPLVGFHFALDFGGKIVGFFTECSGIGSENEVIEHKVTNDSGHEIVMKIPGRLKWENIVLKRGITSSMDIWDWRKEVEQGDLKTARRDGSIMMKDSKLDKTVAQWDFTRAWPVKITGPQPKADSNEIGIEELTIAHEYITRVK